MKCYKCGYEYSGDGACPSCGTNAIKVNEDYLRRKKEYEESGKVSIGNVSFRQSDSKEDQVYSDEDVEEEDALIVAYRKMKNKAVGAFANSDKRANKGRKSVKTKINILLDKARKAQDTKRRKAIKEKAQAPNENNNIKKKPIDKRRLYIIAGGILAIIMVLTIVIVLVSRNKDYIFIDSKDGVYEHKNCYNLVANEAGMYIQYMEKKEWITKEPIESYVYSDNMDTIMYVSNNKSYVYQKENKDLGIKGNTISQKMISESGNYICIVTFEEDVYTLYQYSDEDGLKTVSQNANAKSVIYVGDDGKIIYSDIEYSPINGVNSMFLKGYVDNKRVTLCEDYRTGIYLQKENVILAINATNQLLSVQLNEDLTSDWLADDISAIYPTNENNIFAAYNSPIISKDKPQEVILRGNGVYYYLDTNDSYNIVELFKEKGNVSKIAYDTKNEMYYYSIQNELKTVNGEVIAKLNNDNDFLYNQKNKELVYIDEKNNLYKIRKGNTIKIDEKVNTNSLVASLDGNNYTYTKDETTYIVEFGKKKGVNISAKEVVTVIREGKNIYCLEKDNTLLILDKKGKIIQKCSNVNKIWTKTLDT